MHPSSLESSDDVIAHVAFPFLSLADRATFALVSKRLHGVVKDNRNEKLYLLSPEAKVVIELLEKCVASGKGLNESDGLIVDKFFNETVGTAQEKYNTYDLLTFGKMDKIDPTTCAVSDKNAIDYFICHQELHEFLSFTAKHRLFFAACSLNYKGAVRKMLADENFSQISDEIRACSAARFGFVDIIPTLGFYVSSLYLAAKYRQEELVKILYEHFLRSLGDSVGEAKERHINLVNRTLVGLGARHLIPQRQPTERLIPPQKPEAESCLDSYMSCITLCRNG